MQPLGRIYIRRIFFKMCLSLNEMKGGRVNDEGLREISDTIQNAGTLDFFCSLLDSDSFVFLLIFCARRASYATPNNLHLLFRSNVSIYYNLYSDVH